MASSYSPSSTPGASPSPTRFFQSSNQPRQVCFDNPGGGLYLTYEFDKLLFVRASLKKEVIMEPRWLGWSLERE